jgi:hypothetical protein
LVGEAPQLYRATTTVSHAQSATLAKPLIDHGNCSGIHDLGIDGVKWANLLAQEAADAPRSVNHRGQWVGDEGILTEEGRQLCRNGAALGHRLRDVAGTDASASKEDAIGLGFHWAQLDMRLD